MVKVIKGYICRSKNSDQILIATGSKLPEKEEKTGWYRHVPGWFYKMTVRKFKKTFGFSIKPGTCEIIDITISRTKLNEQLTALEKDLKQELK